MNKCFVCNKKTATGNDIYVKTGIFSKDRYFLCNNCFEGVGGVGETKKISSISASSWAAAAIYAEAGAGKHIISDKELQFIKSHKKDIKNYSSNVVKEEENRVSTIKKKITDLLTKKSFKMPASDIDAHLKHKDVDEIKELCEKMYHNGEIGKTGNYRYFILNEEKKKSRAKKSSAPKSEKVDVKAELKKYKEMLDDDLIEQEDYDAKKKELLGL